MKMFFRLIILSAFASSCISLVAAKTPFNVDSVNVTNSVNTASAGVVGSTKKKSDKYPISATVSVGSSVLRLRSWPWGRVENTFPTGTTLEIIGEKDEFYEVVVNGQKGYMHKNYISTKNKPASESDPYYPGNTRSGGHISENGISNSSVMVKSTVSADPAALANYTGGKLPPDKFIALFGPIMQERMRQTGVPASVSLAQAILETGWGKSSIGDAKNLFGIKGTGPAGKTVVHTQECYDGKFVTIQDGFRKYNSWQESINDHASLMQNSRYGPSLSAYKQNKNADEYARGIHKAGYATDPEYANKLISLMKSYDLTKWDV